MKLGLHPFFLIFLTGYKNDSILDKIHHISHNYQGEIEVMKSKLIPLFVLVALLATTFVATASAQGDSNLAAVRAATAQFHRSEVAEAAGYFDTAECVEHPVLGGMGYHFVNFGLLDLELNPTQPEILVYAPSPSGKLKLVAVEYAVPIEPWDAVYDYPPSVLGQELHAAPHLGLYILHAWVWQHNPAGMFADWNPNVSCEL